MANQQQAFQSLISQLDATFEALKLHSNEPSNKERPAAQIKDTLSLSELAEYEKMCACLYSLNHGGAGGGGSHQHATADSTGQQFS